MKPTKAQTNNYRQGDDEHNCLFCRNKQLVPYNWCEHVGQQVNYSRVCDQYKVAE